MWGRWTLALTVTAAVGCGAGTSGQPRTDASVRPSSARSTSASPSASTDAAGATLAVIRESGVLELFTIDAGARVARRLRVLEPPAPKAKARSVTLSGGASPMACALWTAGARDTVACYEPAASTGVVVSGPALQHPAQLALSFTGRSLAWVDLDSGPPEHSSYHDVCGGRFDGRRVSQPVCIPAREPGEQLEDTYPAMGVSALAWASENTLLISNSVDDDVNASIAIARIDVGDPPPWDESTYVRTDGDTWPLISGAVSSSATSDVLLVQGGFASTGAQTGRAVRMNVTSGRIVDVVATALPGRQVRSVSGGERGVLYRTGDYDRDVRTYWRMPGEKRGLPLLGLPSDARDVLAQP
jgi:hypothetical protein